MCGSCRLTCPSVAERCPAGPAPCRREARAGCTLQHGRREEEEEERERSAVPPSSSRHCCVCAGALLTLRGQDDVAGGARHASTARALQFVYVRVLACHEQGVVHRRRHRHVAPVYDEGHRHCAQRGRRRQRGTSDVEAGGEDNGRERKPQREATVLTGSRVGGVGVTVRGGRSMSAVNRMSWAADSGGGEGKTGQGTTQGGIGPTTELPWREGWWRREEAAEERERQPGPGHGSRARLCRGNDARARSTWLGMQMRVHVLLRSRCEVVDARGVALCHSRDLSLRESSFSALLSSTPSSPQHPLHHRTRIGTRRNSIISKLTTRS